MARYQWIMTAHYDGQSDWYDEFNAPHAAATRPYVIELMGLLREAARVLKPGGLLLFWGAHPCFNGPHIENRDDGALIIHPTYGTRGRHPRSSWWPKGGVRDRVGMSQVALPDLINAFVDAGLTIERVYEPHEQPIPNILAVRAVRHQGS
jgi:SAM-dependent methyltransferase